MHWVRPGRGRSVSILAAAVTLTALLLPSVALAHAELDTITPADGSTAA